MTISIKKIKAKIKGKGKKLYLVDGSGYIFRAFYAMPMMVSPSGVPVNAVYGFVNMLFRTLERCGEESPICVVFDAKRKNFRHDIYPEYKANRGAPPEELVPQFELIRKACDAFGAPQIEIEGFEADDLIATYAKVATLQGYDVVIISSDKDLMQLVNGNVKLYDPMKDKLIGHEDVIAKFGVAPNKVVDVQALAGDSSDNIPGVPGIGVKTAALLINEYGDLYQLLDNADKIKQPKRRQALLENKDLALISRKLVSLCDNVNINKDIKSSCKRLPYDSEKVLGFLEEMGFNSIIARMRNNGVINKNTVTNKADVLQDGDNNNGKDSHSNITKSKKGAVNYRVINCLSELNEFINKVKFMGKVAIDTETDSLNAMQAKLVGISMSHTPGEAVYIPLGHDESGLFGLRESNLDKELTNNTSERQKDNDNDKNNDEYYKQLRVGDVIEVLGPILSDPTIIKIGHNIKYDLHILREAGFGNDIKAIDDTMLLSYVCDNNTHGHSMDELAKLYLGHENIKYSDVVGKGSKAKTFDKLDIAEAYEYACEDADITLQLYNIFKPSRLLKEKQHFLYERIERPLITVLTKMESYGIKIDVEYFRKLSRDLTLKINNKEEIIYNLAGVEFNIASPKQLSEVLFERLSLVPSKNVKSKTVKNKAPSTNVAVLEDLVAQGHEIATHILDWRHYSKLKNTYIDALEKQVNPNTGRIHTNYSMIGAFTGRLSSSDPNLQNIPIRTVEGRAIRHGFVAERKNVLISLDYSQIELRLLAHMGDIPEMIEDFKNNKDIHRATAAKVMGIAEQDVTSDMRSHAKAVNFGIIYGISAFGLARQLGVSSEDAQVLIDSYHKQYPGIKVFMDSMQEQARSNGYVKTLFGRKCFTPEIHSKNYSLRSNAERQAINAPLQGTAADIIKLAMVSIDDTIESMGIDAKMLLQVHDELVFEVPEENAEDIARIMQKKMSSVVELSVPLVVDYGIANNWEDAH